MNNAMTKRTRGRVCSPVDPEALADLMIKASACAYCQGPLETFGSAVDHIMPLARGGSHTLDNLTVTCQPCNRAKGDLTRAEFEEWLTGIIRRFPRMP